MIKSVFLNRSNHKSLQYFSSSIQTQYERALAKMKQNESMTVSNDLKLKVYSLFKQVECGPISLQTDLAKPGMFDLVGKAKHEAWRTLGNMHREEAMKEYVKTVGNILNEDFTNAETTPTNTKNVVSSKPNNSQLKTLCFPNKSDQITNRTYKTIKHKFNENGKLEILLNRPSRGNAFDIEMWQEFKSAFEAIDEGVLITDPNLNHNPKVVILSGEGNSFSTGMDLSVFMEIQKLMQSESCDGRRREGIMRIIQFLQDAITATEACSIPVIAAVTGNCIGGAIDLICACDLRYCTKAAQFCIKETDLAMVADIGTLQRLPKIIGDQKTRELTYTGRTFNGEEAKAMGLVLECLEDEIELRQYVDKIADEICSKSPLTIRGIKKTILFSRDHPNVKESLEQIKLWNTAFLFNDDLMEAMRATLAKESPKFKGMWGLCGYKSIYNQITILPSTADSSKNPRQNVLIGNEDERDEISKSLETVRKKPFDHRSTTTYEMNDERSTSSVSRDREFQIILSKFGVDEGSITTQSLNNSWDITTQDMIYFYHEDSTSSKKFYLAKVLRSRFDNQKLRNINIPITLDICFAGIEELVSWYERFVLVNTGSEKHNDITISENANIILDPNEKMLTVSNFLLESATETILKPLQLKDQSVFIQKFHRELNVLYQLILGMGYSNNENSKENILFCRLIKLGCILIQKGSTIVKELYNKQEISHPRVIVGEQIMLLQTLSNCVSLVRSLLRGSLTSYYTVGLYFWEACLETVQLIISLSSSTGAVPSNRMNSFQTEPNGVLRSHHITSYSVRSNSDLSMSTTKLDHQSSSTGLTHSSIMKSVYKSKNYFNLAAPTVQELLYEANQFLSSTKNQEKSSLFIDNVQSETVLTSTQAEFGKENEADYNLRFIFLGINYMMRLTELERSQLNSLSIHNKSWSNHNQWLYACIELLQLSLNIDPPSVNRSQLKASTEELLANRKKHLYLAPYVAEMIFKILMAQHFLHTYSLDRIFWILAKEMEKFSIRLRKKRNVYKRSQRQMESQNENEINSQIKSKQHRHHRSSRRKKTQFVPVENQPNNNLAIALSLAPPNGPIKKDFIHRPMIRSNSFDSLSTASIASSVNDPALVYSRPYINARRKKQRFSKNVIQISRDDDSVESSCYSDTGSVMSSDSEWSFTDKNGQNNPSVKSTANILAKDMLNRDFSDDSGEDEKVSKPHHRRKMQTTERSNRTESLVDKDTPKSPIRSDQQKEMRFMAPKKVEPILSISNVKELPSIDLEALSLGTATPATAPAETAVDVAKMRVQFKIGDVVDGLCTLPNGSKRWYPGTITSVVNLIGTTEAYTIQYNDGEVQTDKPATELKHGRARRVPAKIQNTVATATVVEAPQGSIEVKPEIKEINPPTLNAKDALKSIPLLPINFLAKSDNCSETNLHESADNRNSDNVHEPLQRKESVVFTNTVVGVELFLGENESALGSSSSFDAIPFHPGLKSVDSTVSMLQKDQHIPLDEVGGEGLNGFDELATDDERSDNATSIELDDDDDDEEEEDRVFEIPSIFEGLQQYRSSLNRTPDNIPKMHFGDLHITAGSLMHGTSGVSLSGALLRDDNNDELDLHNDENALKDGITLISRIALSRSNSNTSLPFPRSRSGSNVVGTPRSVISVRSATNPGDFSTNFQQNISRSTTPVRQTLSGTQNLYYLNSDRSSNIRSELNGANHSDDMQSFGREQHYDSNMSNGDSEASKRSGSKNVQKLDTTLLVSNHMNENRYHPGANDWNSGRTTNITSSAKDFSGRSNYAGSITMNAIMNVSGNGLNTWRTDDSAASSSRLGTGRMISFNPNNVPRMNKVKEPLIDETDENYSKVDNDSAGEPLPSHPSSSRYSNSHRRNRPKSKNSKSQQKSNETNDHSADETAIIDEDNDLNDPEIVDILIRTFEYVATILFLRCFPSKDNRLDHQCCVITHQKIAKDTDQDKISSSHGGQPLSNPPTIGKETNNMTTKSSFPDTTDDWTGNRINIVFALREFLELTNDFQVSKGIAEISLNLLNTQLQSQISQISKPISSENRLTTQNSSMPLNSLDSMPIIQSTRTVQLLNLKHIRLLKLLTPTHFKKDSFLKESSTKVGEGGFGSVFRVASKFNQFNSRFSYHQICLACHAVQFGTPVSSSVTGDEALFHSAGDKTSIPPRYDLEHSSGSNESNSFNLREVWKSLKKTFSSSNKGKDDYHYDVNEVKDTQEQTAMVSRSGRNFSTILPDWIPKCCCWRRRSMQFDSNLNDDAGGGEQEIHFAVKRIPRERSEHDNSMLFEMYNEVRCLELLRGSIGVCQLMDYGVSGSEYWLIMENGLCDLQDWQTKQQNLKRSKSDDSPNERSHSIRKEEDAELIRDLLLYLSIYLDILLLVRTIHTRNIVHFDIKSSNFIFRLLPNVGGGLSLSQSNLMMQIADKGDDQDNANHLQSSPNGLLANTAQPTGVSSDQNIGSFINFMRRCHKNQSPSGLLFIADFGEAAVFEDSVKGAPSLNLDHGDATVMSHIPPRCRGTLSIQSPEMLSVSDSSHQSDFSKNGSNLTQQNLSDHRDQSSLSSPAIVQRKVFNRPGKESDVWSLGCLLVELITGKLLFDGCPWTELFVTLCMNNSKVSSSTLQTFDQTILAWTGPGLVYDKLRSMVRATLEIDPIHRISLNDLIVALEDLLHDEIFANYFEEHHSSVKMVPSSSIQSKPIPKPMMKTMTVDSSNRQWTQSGNEFTRCRVYGPIPFGSRTYLNTSHAVVMSTSPSSPSNPSNPSMMNGDADDEKKAMMAMGMTHRQEDFTCFERFSQLENAIFNASIVNVLQSIREKNIFSIKDVKMIEYIPIHLIVIRDGEEKVEEGTVGHDEMKGNEWNEKLLWNDWIPLRIKDYLLRDVPTAVTSPSNENHHLVLKIYQNDAMKSVTNLNSMVRQGLLNSLLLMDSDRYRRGEVLMIVNLPKFDMKHHFRKRRGHTEVESKESKTGAAVSSEGNPLHDSSLQPHLSEEKTHSSSSSSSSSPSAYYSIQSISIGTSLCIILQSMQDLMQLLCESNPSDQTILHAHSNSLMENILSYNIQQFWNTMLFIHDYHEGCKIEMIESIVRDWWRNFSLSYRPLLAL